MEEVDGYINRAVYETLARHLDVKRGRESLAAFHDRLEALAAKSWGVPRAVANEIVRTRWVRRTYENLLKHLKIKRAKDEGLKEFRERAEAAIGERWNGYAGATMRALFGLRRRPSAATCPQFFKDLVEYGRAEFRKNGDVIRASLGKGPTSEQFFAVTPAGKDKGAQGHATSTRKLPVAKMMSG